MGRFDDKVALLTGAASGIGRATALQLSSEGGRIFAVDVNEAGLAETADRVRKGGGEIEVARCDVRERQACFDTVAAAAARFGRLDVLGNIAGVNRFTHFHEMDAETWELLRGVNLDGVIYMTQAAIPHLLESEGSVVNIASQATFIGQAYTGGYCATKGAVGQLTKALAMEYARKKVRFNAIAPGGVDTEMNETLQLPPEVNGKLIQRFASFRGACPPEEIARVFAFLASGESPYTHGAIWPVDGGTTAG